MILEEKNLEFSEFKDFLEKTVRWLKDKNYLGMEFLSENYRRVAIHLSHVASFDKNVYPIYIAEAILLFSRGEKVKYLARIYLASLLCYSIEGKEYLTYVPTNWAIKQAFFILKSAKKPITYQRFFSLFEKKEFPVFSKKEVKKYIKETIKEIDLNIFIKNFAENLFDFA